MPTDLFLRVFLLSALCWPLAACGTKGNLYRSEEPAASMDRAPQQLVLAQFTDSFPRDVGGDGAPTVAIAAGSAHRVVGA